MSSIVYFLNNFNNYYNRIIKKYDSVSDYINEIGEENYAVRGDGTTVIPGNKGPVNFNINDGVNAMLTYNYDQNQDWQPNYILVCDMEHTIKSRWFVIEAKRTRQGQYKLNLHRDVIADNYEATMQSVSLIENATLDKRSKYIFNSEGNTYNQIKQEETLLKDKIGSASPNLNGWIVGYCTALNPEDTTKEDVSAYISVDDYLTYSGTASDFIKQYKKFIIGDLSLAEISFYSKGEKTNAQMETTVSSSGVDIDWTLLWTQYARFVETTSSSVIKSNINSKKANALLELQNLYASFYKSYNIYKTLPTYYSTYDKKYVKCSDGLFYVRYIQGYNYNAVDVSALGDTTAFNTAFKAMIDGSYTDTGNSNLNKIYGSCNIITYGLDLQNVTNANVKVSINNKMSMLSDAPYYMFAIPNGVVKIKDSNTTFTTGLNYFNTIPNIAINLGNRFYANSKLYKSYDVQLVPYCPMQDLWDGDELDLTNLDSTQKAYVKMDDDIGLELSVMLWCKVSKGSFNIIDRIDIPDDATDFKIENETTFYRLNSPNYNGVYEFKPTKNNGVSKFNVDWWYKPGQPYIHINPDFELLYGYDSNDARGLICQGDFSIPQTNDQWTEYVRNNTNYQNSFNRSIQNQEVKRNIERINQAVGFVSNTAAGAINGAKMGAGSAIAGGIAGAVGGAADIALSEYSYNEQISYATDQFNYQLGNVKALGESITNVGSITPNNKIYPFLEKWSCTDEEKAALRAKLQYNGMTVGVIDSIQNYLRDEESFIRAKLIRFSDTGDMHLVATIAEELHKGVYLKK